MMMMMMMMTELIIYGTFHIIFRDYKYLLLEDRKTFVYKNFTDRRKK
jgi:hypothetical protein